MIRFIGNDAEGLPLKRKQSQRACEKCRKRKKRCPHQASASTVEADTSHANADSSPRSASVSRTKSPASSPRTRTPRNLPGPLSSSSAPRIPPSQIPTSATSLSNHIVNLEDEDCDDDDGEDQNPRFVGDLNPEGIFVAAASPEVATTAAAASSPNEVVGVWIPRKLVNAAKALPGPILPLLLPHLEDECSRMLPTATDYNTLHRLYVEEVHPILPVINLESLQSQQRRPKTLLKLAICLSVSDNPRAATHLRQPPKDFAVQATQLLRSAIDNGLVRDRQVIMQLLIVLALSTQLSDDRHASPEFTARAITHVQTSGLHLDTSVNSSSHAYSTQLFCCTFALDRLNAAVQGRPVLMHERDLGRDMEVCINQQNSLFQLLLRVVLILDRVITLYRPSNGSSSATENGSDNVHLAFPTFEDLLGSCGTMRAPANLIATVETLYHAVAMLSCRSRSLAETSRISESYTRQSLSAASVVSIVGNEYRGQLSILAFVPYAMSLALRVCYRDLRLSRSPFMRVRARRQLLNVCRLLRELGDKFSSSVQMVELAEKTVRQMDKAYSNMAGQRKGSVAPGVPSSCQGNARSNLDAEDDAEGIVQRCGTVAAPGRLIEDTALGITNDLGDNYDMQTFDAAQFDLDLDIFDYFDPEFDIHAIDVALADSIDPSLPMDLRPSDSFDA